MTNEELIKRVLTSLSKECEEFCYDFEKDSSIYLYKGTYYRIYKRDVEVADTLITKLKSK